MTRPTTRPGSESTTLQVGDQVRCQREMPTTGTWGRYDGRTGFVTTINRQKFPSGTTYVEIGVTFEDRFRPEARADAWFRADELVPS